MLCVSVTLSVSFIIFMYRLYLFVGTHIFILQLLTHVSLCRAQLRTFYLIFSNILMLILGYCFVLQAIYRYSFHVAVALSCSMFLSSLYSHTPTLIVFHTSRPHSCFARSIIIVLVQLCAENISSHALSHSLSHYLVILFSLFPHSEYLADFPFSYMSDSGT